MAIWLDGPSSTEPVSRQANGRPHRIGQRPPVRLLYAYYAETLQKTALDLAARKVTASQEVDGLSLTGALFGDDRRHADATLAFGQALYRVAVGVDLSR